MADPIYTGGCIGTEREREKEKEREREREYNKSLCTAPTLSRGLEITQLILYDYVL